MKNCKTKPETTCGTRGYATCVYYEGYIPPFSSLDQDDCNTVHETLEDIYNEMETMQDEADLSELGNECITYTETAGRILIKDAFKAMETKICELAALTTTMGETITTMQEQIEQLQEGNCPE